MNAEYMNETLHQTESIEFSREDASTYLGKMDAAVDMTMEYANEDSDSPDAESVTQSIEAALTGDIEFKFGDDLGTLKESSRWNDVYDMEWGTLEDALEGLNSLGSAFSGMPEIG
jgi:hypothetical protein